MCTLRRCLFHHSTLTNHNDYFIPITDIGRTSDRRQGEWSGRLWFRASRRIEAGPRSPGRNEAPIGSLGGPLLYAVSPSSARLEECTVGEGRGGREGSRQRWEGDDDAKHCRVPQGYALHTEHQMSTEVNPHVCATRGPDLRMANEVTFQGATFSCLSLRSFKVPGIFKRERQFTKRWGQLAVV